MAAAYKCSVLNSRLSRPKNSIPAQSLSVSSVASVFVAEPPDGEVILAWFRITQGVG